MTTQKYQVLIVGHRAFRLRGFKKYYSVIQTQNLKQQAFKSLIYYA